MKLISEKMVRSGSIHENTMNINAPTAANSHHSKFTLLGKMCHFTEQVKFRKKSSKRPFALIEILLVIAIVAIIAGVVGINIQRAILQQRFHNEVNYILGQLNLAQNLMLINKTSARVKFKQTEGEGGILVWIELDCKISKNWEKEIVRGPKKLETIRYVNFYDENREDFDFLKSDVKNQVEVQFLNGGGYVSRGIVALSTAEKEEVEGSLSSFILIKGYVAPFTVLLKRPDGMVGDSETEQNRQISSQTIAEVLERQLQ